MMFAATGIVILVAAVRFDPEEAKGMDATLRSFTQTPVGPWLLVAVAIGPVLFEVFSSASARHPPPRVSGPSVGASAIPSVRAGTARRR
jgi:hypothetical protein